MREDQQDLPAPERRAPRGAWAACIFGVALLLFVWPFLRNPPLDIGRSYAHLLGSWAAAILALALLARALGRDRGAGEPGA